LSIFATVTGYLKETFRGGTKTVSISKVSAGANNYSPLNAFAPGFEICPADGEHLVITKIENSESFMVTIGGINQNIEPITNKGERRIFSVSANGLEIKAQALFKNNGTLVLNDGEESAVMFSKLKEGFDQLKSDFNTFLSHVHSGGTLALGLTGPASPPATPSTASIDDAESATVKLP